MDIDQKVTIMNSRYYNPEWGRFISSDSYLNANGDLIGFNLYAYCSNEPVIRYDPKGEWTFSIGFNISAFLVGGVSLSTCISFDSSGGYAIQSTIANVFEKEGGVVIGPCSVGLSSTTQLTKCD